MFRIALLGAVALATSCSSSARAESDIEKKSVLVLQFFYAENLRV